MFKFNFFRKKTTIEEEINDLLEAKNALVELYAAREEILCELNKLNDHISEYEKCVNTKEKKTTERLDNFKGIITAYEEAITA